MKPYPGIVCFVHFQHNFILLLIDRMDRANETADSHNSIIFFERIEHLPQPLFLFTLRIRKHKPHQYQNGGKHDKEQEETVIYFPCWRRGIGKKNKKIEHAHIVG